jgi:hypothetical protein
LFQFDVVYRIVGGRRACVIATFTCALIPFLAIFAHLDTSTSVPTSALLCALGIMGCLIGGFDIL